MEICTIIISKELLQTLVDSEAITTDDFTVKLVNEDSFDYSSNEAWEAQKKISTKAYKKLKKIEFNIRNK
jgi:hypothetical protein